MKTVWDCNESACLSHLGKHVHIWFVGVLQQGLATQSLHWVVSHAVAKYDNMLHNCYPFIGMILLNVGDTHDVGEYTGCSYAGSGSITLNHHRVFLVALGGEQYNVVAAFEVVERMLWTYSLQAYAGLATVEGCHEAPALVLDVEGLALCLEFCIQLRQLLPEIIQTALEVFVRYEEVLFYVILFYTVACFTREDNQLAYNVHTAQVDAWIRLAIALLFGETNGLREWYDTRD